MNEKVLVTGINIISSLGLTIDENWENLVNGRSGIKKISLFNPEKLDTQIAGQVPEEFEEYSKQFIKNRLSKQMTRVSRICLTAAKATIERHNIPISSYDSERCAVILGVVNTGNSSSES